MSPAATGPGADAVQPAGSVPSVVFSIPAGIVSVTVIGFALVETESDGPSFVTVRVQVTDPPAFTGLEPVLSITRSADAVTGTSASSVLFDGSGSWVAPVTVAVLSTGESAGSKDAAACAVTVMTGKLAPEARVSALFVRAQSKPVVDTRAQSHPSPETPVTLKPSGSAPASPQVSLTVKGPTASSGPVLVTVIVHAVPAAPPAIRPVPGSFCSCRSAEWMKASAVASGPV